MTKRILLGFFSVILCFSAVAQQNMTLYQMHDIWQSHSLNPSVPSNCRWNVAFPVLGNISFAAGFPVSYNDLGAGSEIVDGKKVISLLKNNNLISLNGNISLFTIGYRTASSYFQFTVNERFSFASAFSRDPVELLILGNAPFAGKTLTGNLNFSALYFREYAVSAAFELGDNTWVGARGRLMFGRLSAFGKNKISLYTDPDTYVLTVNSSVDSKISVPGTVETDPVAETAKNFHHELEPQHFIFNPSNIGGALDLGFNTTLESGWKISASLLNLGVINWSKHLRKFDLTSTKTYSGAGGLNTWDELIDTLKTIYKPYNVAPSGYSQLLSPTLMAGANYPVADYLRVGMTGYGAYSPTGAVPWAVSAILQTQGISFFHGVLSYTVTNSSLVNIGLGLGLEAGPFNIHFMTDNLIAFFNPASQRYATFQFGINFKFGCSDDIGESKSKKYKSVPCPSFGGYTGLKSVPCSK